MKKLYLLLLFSVFFANAQQDAWVYFTDKPDADFYLANPLEMLTQKSLDRRATQGIQLDITDVPVHQEYIETVASSAGITVMAKSKWLNALHVRGEQEAVSALTSLSFVSSVYFADKTLNGLNKPAHLLKQQETAAVNKQLDAQTDYNYGNGATQIEMLNGHLLHQANFTGSGMTIAVLDNGFPASNAIPALQHLFTDNLVLGGYNFVAGTDNVYTGGTHGTLVLSTMGSRSENQLVGTAPDAFYYLFVTEDTAQENPVEESYWVEAAEAADSLGVDVINTSLGYFTYDNPNYSYTYEDMDGETSFISRGANVAFSKGIFLVTSAGNSGAGINPHISVPADAFNTLTIGAVNASEEYATFSSIGPSYDGRVKPDVMAMGQGSAYSGADGAFYSGNGTSFSSPITAGLVACLWQALPGLTNAELLQRIRQSADRYNNPDANYGYGIPDFWAAYQSALSVQSVSQNKIILYPNPVLDRLYLNVQTVATLTVFNTLGQKVFEVKVNPAESVEVSVLPAGTYNYIIASNEGSTLGKLIKL